MAQTIAQRLQRSSSCTYGRKAGDPEGHRSRGIRIPEGVSLMAISDGEAPSFLYPNVMHSRHSGVEIVSARRTCRSA